MRRNPYTGPYRHDPQPRLNFSGELSVDLFAGGGGASTGHEWATGKSPDIAVNHNRQAVLMHQINHPHTRHFCESVFAVDPAKVCDGRPVGHLWMSPDCTHFSKAKGSKPVSKRVRGLAWVGKRWAATVRPRVIFLENVEEFQTWGPLVRIDGNLYPCKKRAGRTFRTFVRELERLGYVVEWQTMRACDYGAPTIRKRLFLVARCDGEPIVWPKPTHGDPVSETVKSGRLLPWRTAAECIDWSIPCPSIFTRKKPLAENTQRRIARGIQRYVIDNPEPFIVPITHHGTRQNHSIKEPLKTVTAAHRGELALVAPHFTEAVPTFKEWYSDTKNYGGTREEYDRLYPSAPIGFIAPSLTEHANGSSQRTFPINEPLRTQCAQVKGGHFALQSAMLLKHYGGVVGTAIDHPAGTITTQDHHSIGAATLIQTGYGERPGQAPRVPHLDKPIGTMMAGGVKHAVAAAHMVRHFGESVGSAATDPVGTITAGGMGKTALSTATLVRNFGSSTAVDIEAPHPTVVSKQKDSLVASSLIKLRGTCRDGQRTDEPMPTVTAGGMHVGEVRAFLLKYYGADQDPRMDEPLHTVTTKHRFGLVTVNGILHQIVDIGMRMLAPRELYRAQGFGDDYIIDHVIEDGKIVPLTITDQVRFCGNSVAPHMAYVLYTANGAGQKRLAA